MYQEIAWAHYKVIRAANVRENSNKNTKYRTITLGFPQETPSFAYNCHLTKHLQESRNRGSYILSSLAAS